MSVDVSHYAVAKLLKANKHNFYSCFLKKNMIRWLATFGALGLVAAVDYQEPTTVNVQGMGKSLVEKHPSHISYTAVTHEAIKLEKLDTSGFRLLDPNIELAVPSTTQGGIHEPNTEGRSK